MIERKVDAWGRTIFHGDDIIELLFRDCNIANICVEKTIEIDEYNKFCMLHDKLEFSINPIIDPTCSPEEEIIRRQDTWWMPAQYYDLDVRSKLLNMCQRKIEIDRVNDEMNKYEERGLLPVLRLVCYFVDRWRERDVVWGVGRGSSVSSYCLFLIGIHKIDSIYYELDIDEFLK